MKPRRNAIRRVAEIANCVVDQTERRTKDPTYEDLCTEIHDRGQVDGRPQKWKAPVNFQNSRPDHGATLRFERDFRTCVREGQLRVRQQRDGKRSLASLSELGSRIRERGQTFR